MRESCVVGVQVVGLVVKAFKVCIAQGGDVYVNYAMTGVPEAHTSYHASGQKHSKIGRKCMADGELFTPPPRPTRNVITRSACQDPIAWRVADLPKVLPSMTRTADITVDARCLSENALLLFKISVVGNWARECRIRAGFRKIKTHHFGSRVRVEIEAFETSPLASGILFGRPLLLNHPIRASVFATDRAK